MPGGRYTTGVWLRNPRRVAARRRGVMPRNSEPGDSSESPGRCEVRRQSPRSVLSKAEGTDSYATPVVRHRFQHG